MPTATPSDTNAAAAVEAPSSQITIDFVDYDLQGALRRLAAKAGVNLILGEEVTGKVTVHLEDVPYAEAMRLIAESKGYAFIQDKTVAKPGEGQIQGITRYGTGRGADVCAAIC